MITASALTVVLLYLVGLRQADKRSQRVSREVKFLKEITICSLIDF